MPATVTKMATRCLLPVLLSSVALAFSAQEKKNDKKKWDVTAAHGPTTSVKFTTDEGTWMNLDVSPDGSEIVFDLLGNLYTLPIAGGKATPLTTGPEFDVQPRYSPDGSHISFTSDRAGGDNIWFMKRDGSDPKQVTKESFRLLNNATWSPDGQYLIARKHFTSTRSLGAGEMWMYHIHQGGSGVQLTKRKNDQQDAGEPVMSPDGKYLYFSEDMSGGRFFQYNKDPNTQIYVIRRLDLASGELINYISGPGGAARPQISRDGRYLSFVRRVRLKSVLYVHDLTTGQQWPVYDDLSHDQQEAWAIFGVYPNYAWLPDNASVVLWAKGHLWKVNVETATAAQIPFSVNVDLTVTEAVQSTQPAFESEFEVKMVRNAVTSPDGKWLAFNAAGHLWKKALPDGIPERLTNAADFEYYPAFSPDSRWITYISWNDSTLGAVMRADVRRGRARRVTTEKGYYFTPSFSPDGSKIVYTKGRGNSLVGYAFGLEPGLYWSPAEGGDATLITRSGRNPRFNSTGDRIYYLSGGGLSKEFKSIGTDGKEDRVLFKLKYVNSIVPSPDDKWIAFTELFNAYVVPFVRTGTPITLNKDTKALPVQRVTRDAGNYLHWSGDSRKLHWTIGPEYFTRDLNRTFAFLPGAPDSLPKPDTAGVRIGLRLQADVPSGSVAFTNARLITMNGDEIIARGTVVVNGNRIAAVGPAGDVSVPSGAHVVDATGKTIIPGLIDVHAHIFGGSGVTPQQAWGYYANLAFGVTTTHDPSNNTEMVFSQSEMVKAGRIVGPRIFSTGTILYGADGDFKAVVNSYDDALSHLRRMQAVGAFSVKSYNQPRRDQRQQVLKAARELGMLVYPEGGSTFFHNVNMIIDGHTGIEHALPIAPLHNDVLSLWEMSKTGYTPTFVVAYGGLSGEYYWYQHTNVWENERLLNFVPRTIVDARSRRRTMAPDNDFNHVEVAKSAKAFVDRGGKVQIGGHGQMQGLAAHWELWIMAQGGMTPLQVLRCGTQFGADYLGMGSELGSLQTGKLADLVVLDANPIENIRNTERIAMVMKNGRLFDAATMHELGNHARKRAPFWWERAKASEEMALDEELAHGCGCGRH